MRTEIVLEMFITVKPGLTVVFYESSCYAMLCSFILLYNYMELWPFVWYLFCVNDKGVSER